MSNVQNPTYFLAPNWNFHPGGRISIGNIVKNPLKPHLPLTKADPDRPAATDTSKENNWRLSVETATSLSLSLWGVFFEKIRVGFTGDRQRTKSSNFTMSSLDTVYLSKDPSPAEIKARCNDPLVRQYMRLDSVLCSPVYMITGLKIAKDFKLEGEKSLSRGVEGELGAEVAPEASVGGKAGISKTNRIADGFESESDIVFAYQLMRIKPKGWFKGKTLETNEYQHRQAFLGDNDKVEEDVEVEMDSITLDDLKELEKAEILTLEEAAVAYSQPK